MNNYIAKRDLGLLTDYYEFLMMQGYLKNFENVESDIPITTFDVFYRKNPFCNGFSVFAGLNEIIDYIENLKFTDEDIEYLKDNGAFDTEFLDYLKHFRFTGDIYSFVEGSVISKNEPIIKVVAKITEAQLIESAILSLFNHETLIATKAYRVCTAASPHNVMEFGLRRAMSFDAAIYGAKAACIAGCIGTSNVLSAKMFDVPALGTMAHSWIMSFDDELSAFIKFATLYPDMCILLVDTYDTLNIGIPNAIKTFDYMKKNHIESKKYGIRIDSGDLAYLSKEARKMLDAAGYSDAIICASNDIDEEVIASLKSQGAKIDLYGVGTKLITGAGEVLGGVYKLSSIYDKNKSEFIPKIKISSNAEKITNPGNKNVYRVYNSENKIVADLLTLEDEKIDMSADLLLFDSLHTWKKQKLKAGTYTIKNMLVKIFDGGKLVYDKKTVGESHKHFVREIETLYDDNKRLINPRDLYVDLSKKLYDTKYEILNSYNNYNNYNEGN